jgi:hypothetical protein
MVCRSLTYLHLGVEGFTSPPYPALLILRVGPAPPELSSTLRAPVDFFEDFGVVLWCSSVTSKLLRLLWGWDNTTRLPLRVGSRR